MALATLPYPEDFSGTFFRNGREQRLKPNVLDLARAASLWELSERLVKAHVPPRAVAPAMTSGRAVSRADEAEAAGV